MYYILIKSFVLILTFLGYAMLYQKRRLPLCFFPVTAVSGVTVLIYLAGLFGYLKAGCYAVICLGILALLKYCTKDRIKAIFCDESIWFLAFATIWLYQITRGAMLSHFDEGTHWYRICKAMNYEGAFPSTPDILFRDYVPGCATWVYFLTRFVNFSIPNAMFSQSFLNLVAVTAIFCAIPKENRGFLKVFFFVLITAVSVLLCSLTVSTYTLLVDAQIGLFALAALMFVLEYGETKDAFFPIAAVLGFLSLIKTSSLLFIAMIFIWACFRHRYRIKDWLKAIMGWIGFPVLFYASYLLRSRIVYGSASNGYQNVSLERYVSILGEKNSDTIAAIAKRFFSEILSFRMGGVIAVYVSILLFVLIFLCLREEGMLCKAKRTKQEFCGILVTMTAYVLSLFATYLFSMRVDEAMTLNSLYRYYGTGAILVVGMTVYSILKLANQLDHSQMYVLSLLLIFALLTPGAFSKQYILSVDKYQLEEDFRSDIWKAMELYIPQNSTYTEESYVVMWNEDDFYGGSRDHGRMNYIAGSWLRSTDIMVISEHELRDGISQEKLQMLQMYDHLACLSDMSSYSELFSQTLGTVELTPGLRDIPHNQ